MGAVGRLLCPHPNNTTSRRGRPTADADTAGNEQADPRCPTLHFLAPLIRSRDFFRFRVNFW
jgi:hypothetical protein